MRLKAIAALIIVVAVNFAAWYLLNRPVTQRSWDGVIASVSGVKGCYLIDAITFAGSFYGVGRLPAMRPTGTRNRTRGKLALSLEGLSFIRRSQVRSALAQASASAFVSKVLLCSGWPRRRTWAACSGATYSERFFFSVR